jgi:hypothetical protein
MNQWTFLLLFAGQALILAGFGAGLLTIARRLTLDTLWHRTACVFLMLSLIGLGAFWIAWWSWEALQVARAVIAAAMAVALIDLVRDRQALRALKPYAEPAAFSLLLAGLVLGYGFTYGGVRTPTDTAAVAFSHALPVDNALPFLLAEALRSGAVPSPLIGDWLSSDRPALQTGLFALLSLPGSARPQIYLALSVLLQTSFFFGVWALCMAMRLPGALRRLVLLGCCLLPVTIVNSIYTWPKLLPVGFLALLAVLLFERKWSHPEWVRGVLSGGLAGAAALSHGSSFFSLLGLGAAALLLGTVSRGLLLGGFAGFVGHYAPWSLYQRLIDPPGDRLLKFHLAGLEEVTRRPFLEVLIDRYSGLSISDAATIRRDNLTGLFGAPLDHLRTAWRATVSGDPGLAGAVRAADFFVLLPSLQLIGMAALASLGLYALGARGPKQYNAFRTYYRGLWVTVICTCLFFVLLMFKPNSTVNHHGSFATQILVAVLAMTHLGLLSRLFTSGLLAAQACLTAAIYFWLNRRGEIVNPVMLTLALVSGLGLLQLGFSGRWRADERCEGDNRREPDGHRLPSS